MPPEIRALLFDMQHAAIGIALFTAGKSFDDFSGDAMLQRAVERQFEIIGEALGRLRKIDAAFLDKITEAHKIIGLRHVLIHGYDVVDIGLLWGIVQHKLPTLQKELDELMR